MTELISLSELMRLIVAETDYEGGIRPWCSNRQIHPSIVDKFLAGQRGPAPQLLDALGLERIIAFRRK